MPRVVESAPACLRWFWRIRCAAHTTRAEGGKTKGRERNEEKKSGAQQKQENQDLKKRPKKESKSNNKAGKRHKAVVAWLSFLCVFFSFCPLPPCHLIRFRSITGVLECFNSVCHSFCSLFGLALFFVSPVSHTSSLPLALFVEGLLFLPPKVMDGTTSSFRFVPLFPPWLVYHKNPLPLKTPQSPASFSYTHPYPEATPISTFQNTHRTHPPTHSNAPQLNHHYQ